MEIQTIKLAFIINRETFRIEIQGKDVWYADRRWNKSIRLIPRDEDFLKKILFSRGKIPPIIKDLFTLTKKEKEEYDNAKDTKELAEICKRDCQKWGARLLKEDIEEDILANAEDIEKDILANAEDIEENILTNAKDIEEKNNG